MPTYPVQSLFLAVLAVIALGVARVSNATDATPVPDLTQGGERDESHDWNLGPTGATGWIWGRDYHSTDSRQILVTQVDEGSPADGVLEVGDVILGVGRKPFDADARTSFGWAVVEAEKAENLGRLELIRWRQGSVENVVVPLKVMGSYSDSSPWDCEKSRKLIDAGCRHIAMKLEADASFGHALAREDCLLALLASGAAEYQSLVQRYARAAAPHDKYELKRSMGSASAWIWSHTLIFLAEYHLATGDTYVLPAIETYAVRVAEGQAFAGSWGHGIPSFARDEQGRIVHGPVALGYGVVNAAGLMCHLSLVLARKCGVDHPEVARAVDKSNRFFGFFVGKGSIPYGDHAPGVKREFDHNGKTALAAVVFDVQGRRGAARFFARTSLAGYDERDIGHTGNYFSYLWGPLGVNRGGPAAVAAYLKEQRWRYELARRWDGRFGYDGAVAKKSAGGKHSATPYTRWDCTGEFLLPLCLPKSKLYLTGKGVSDDTALTSEQIRETIAVGRAPESKVGRDADFDHLSTEQVIELLRHWSPTVRNRAARSLAEKDGEFAPTLIDMLRGDDAFARIGACQALEQLGERAGEAAPPLIELLSHDDSWTRVCAARAIAAIGRTPETMKSANQLLRMAMRQDPDDDLWQREQRWMSYSLFFGETRNYPLRHAGLLGGSLEGVDRKLLYEAVEALLQNNEAATRAAVSYTVYDNLSFEEIEPLLPAIYKSTFDWPSTNTMFVYTNPIHGVKLLARHRLAEGIDACALHVKNGEARNALRQYGAHAKRVLPELRTVRDWMAERETAALRTAKYVQATIDDIGALIAEIEASEERPELRHIWGEGNPRPEAYRMPPKPSPPTTVPTEPGNLAYLEAKWKFDALMKTGPRCDVLLIGDANVSRFPEQGDATWQRYFAQRNAVPIGIHDDRTQWLLWRLGSGNLQGISPRVVVLMIGENNLHRIRQPKSQRRNSSAETGQGMIAVVDHLRSALPKSHLVVMGILPRAVEFENTSEQKATAILADELRRRADSHITFIDPLPHFSMAGAQDARYFQDARYSGDHPLLDAAGYARWAELIEPAVARGLGEEPKKPGP